MATDIYGAVHQLESSGSTAPGITGDGGYAFGPYQVHQAALTDYNRAYGANYTTSELASQPSVGIAVGQGYLDLMQQRYPDHPDYALGAYNQGPGAMDRAIASGQGTAGLPGGGPTYVQKGLALMGNGADTTAPAGGSSTPGVAAVPPSSGDPAATSGIPVDPMGNPTGGSDPANTQTGPVTQSIINGASSVIPSMSGLSGIGSTIAQYFARAGVAILGLVVIMVALLVMNRGTIVQVASIAAKAA